MRTKPSLKTIGLLALVAVSCGSMSACDLAGGDVQKYVTEPLPVQTIQGSPFNLPLDATGLTFNLNNIASGSLDQIQGTQSLTLEVLALRTVTDDQADSQPQALEDDSLVEKCRSGQLPISFIHSLKISIQKKGQPGTAKVLATYTMPKNQQDQPDVCGFYLQTDNTVNLNDFLPDYETTIEATGTDPQYDTKIAGFAIFKWTGQVTVPTASPTPTGN